MAEYCSDCMTAMEVVFNHSSADIICTKCGLVLESLSIDDSGDKDPVCTVAPTTPLLADSGLSTMIPNPNGVASSLSLGRFQNNVSSPDSRLISAFEKISTMADRLGLAKTIKDRAKEIFKDVSKSNRGGGRNADALLAACLHIACRQEGHPRTHKEISSVATGVKPKEINRAIDYVVKQLKLEMGTINAEDFTRRFCSNLGLTNQALVKAVQEAVEKSKELDIRRSPVSIAAAVIYIVAQKNSDDDNKKPTLGDVSRATGVAEGTIRNVYEDLKPHISKIIPMHRLF